MKNPFIKAILVFLVWHFFQILVNHLILQLHLSTEHEVIIAIITLIILYLIMNYTSII